MITTDQLIIDLELTSPQPQHLLIDNIDRVLPTLSSEDPRHQELLQARYALSSEPTPGSMAVINNQLLARLRSFDEAPSSSADAGFTSQGGQGQTVSSAGSSAEPPSGPSDVAVLDRPTATAPSTSMMSRGPGRRTVVIMAAAAVASVALVIGLVSCSGDSDTSASPAIEESMTESVADSADTQEASGSDRLVVPSEPNLINASNSGGGPAQRVHITGSLNLTEVIRSTGYTPAMEELTRFGGLPTLLSSFDVSTDGEIVLLNWGFDPYTVSQDDSLPSERFVVRLDVSSGTPSVVTAGMLSDDEALNRDHPNNALLSLNTGALRYSTQSGESLPGSAPVDGHEAVLISAAAQVDYENRRPFVLMMPVGSLTLYYGDLVMG